MDHIELLISNQWRLGELSAHQNRPGIWSPLLCVHPEHILMSSTLASGSQGRDGSVHRAGHGLRRLDVGLGHLEHGHLCLFNFFLMQTSQAAKQTGGLQHAALPADVAVDFGLLQPRSWSVGWAKLDLEGCGKQNACVFVGEAAALNLCLLLKTLSDFKQHSSHPSGASSKSSEYLQLQFAVELFTLFPHLKFSV